MAKRFLILGISAAACLFAQNPAVLENDQVRVVNAEHPHQKTEPHEHKLNRVIVYLDAGVQQITDKDGKHTIKFKPGDVKWSQANGTHVSEMVGPTAVRLIEIEIRKPGDPSKTATTALDPLKVSPKVYKLEFENDQVRVSRARYGPHQQVPQHEHMLNRVLVYLTDQHSKMTTPDGKATESEHKAYEVSWGTPAKHVEENVLAKPVEILLIELKN